MKTTYIGTVKASWIKKGRRIAGVEFENGAAVFSLVVPLPRAELGDRYRIELKKELCTKGTAQR